MRILIVEDDDDLRSSMKFLLEQYGYQIFEAASGADALEVLKANPEIHLVISDYYMKNGDGMSLLSQIRKTYSSDLPFFMMTGQFDRSVEDLKNNGVHEVILKPFEIDWLLSLIRSLRS